MTRGNDARCLALLALRAACGWLLWEINDATGAQGTNWDYVSVDGILLLTGIDSANPFTIDVTSLNAGNTPGAAENFNSSQNYTWVFVTASGGISGFNANKFAIDTSNFVNAPGSNGFSISSDDSSLSLNYNAISEPASSALLVGSLLVFIALRDRRRANSSSGRALLDSSSEITSQSNIQTS